MPTREHAPIGAPCWIDLMTSDVDRSRSFYAQVFGWIAEEPNMQLGGYVHFAKDSVRVAGCMSSEPGDSRADSWSIYLATDDARRTLESADCHNGQVMVSATEVGELGVMGHIIDPIGAAIGVWQPILHPGFGVLGEPGSPRWFELHTRHHQAAVSFYRDVFGWDVYVVSDTDEFRLTTMRDGEEQLAGIMDASGYLPQGVPDHWEVYFGVDDTDRALATITDLGGSILKGAEETPFGRMAAAADPTGATFKLVGRL